MKKLIYVTIVILTCFAVSCKKQQAYSTKEEFKVLKTTMKFDYTGGVGEVITNSDNISATADEDWVKPSIDGKVVNLKIAANPGYEARTAILMIKSGEVVKDLPITQLGIISIVNLTDSSFTYKGGEVSYNWNTQEDFEITGLKSWVSYRVDGQKIIFTVLPNDITEERIDTLHVKVGELYFKDIVFKQEAKVQSIYNDLLGDYTLEFNDINGNKQSVDVKLILNIQDESYVMKGLGYDVLVLFDPKKSEISITTQELFDVDGGYKLMACSGSPLYLLSEELMKYGLKAVNSSTDGYKFVFTDNGVNHGEWVDDENHNIIVVGLVGYRFTGEDKAKLLPRANSTIFNPVLTKK